MIGKYAAILAAGALCIAGPASAKDIATAQLSAVKGSVMVSQGGKMVPASAGALRAGDRVVAANGSARVAYADGCVVALPANGMATIGAASPCASGGGLVRASQGSSAQSWYDMSSTTWAIIGAVALIGVIAVVANDDDDDATVSP